MDMKDLADTGSSLNEAKEICSNDATCFEFYKTEYGQYKKCSPDSERKQELGTTLYVKGIFH